MHRLPTLLLFALAVLLLVSTAYASKHADPAAPLSLADELSEAQKALIGLPHPLPLVRLATPTVHFPQRVRVEHLVIAPLNKAGEQRDPFDLVIVEVAQPRFSWELAALEGARDVAQASYQLRLVPEDAPSEGWDSGVVRSARSHLARYTGPALQPHRAYRISLRYTTVAGQRSRWFQGRFRTALVLRGAAGGSSVLSPAALTSLAPEAQWIGDRLGRATQLRMDFLLPSSSGSPVVQSAVLTLATAGYAEAFLDGLALDPSRKLDPAWTTFQARSLYATYEIDPANLSVDAPHTLGIFLGNGWFSQQQWVSPAVAQPSYGPARCNARLDVTFADGSNSTFVSTTNSTATAAEWNMRVSEVLLNSVYMGELVDGRLVDAGWASPVAANSQGQGLGREWGPVDSLPPPTQQLQAQTQPPIRVIAVVEPASVTSPCMNTYIYDFGQNLVGWTRVTWPASAGGNFAARVGVAIRIRTAEVLFQNTGNARADETIYTGNLRGAASTDTYVQRGDPQGEVFEPRFTVHGFRYLEITGAPMEGVTVQAVIVHSFVEGAGKLALNNSVLDQIQRNMLWGQSGNLMSLPTDCPQRDERKGWTGDAGLTVDEAFFNFDALPLFAKFLTDMSDAQSADGGFPDTAPLSFGSAPADPNWGIAFPSILWAAWQHYQDLDLLKQHYPSAEKWINLLVTKWQQTGLKNYYYHYGDWVPPAPAARCNDNFVGGYGFLHNVELFINISSAVNNTGNVARFQTLYKQLAQEMHTTWFNPAINGYADGGQACNVLALSLSQVVPADLRPAVLASLIAAISAADTHLSTGILSTAAIFPLLSASGHHDLALQLATQTTYPGYGFEFNNPYENATTLWELWEAPFAGAGMNSRNHIMFAGGAGPWFWRELAGFKLDGARQQEAEEDEQVQAPRLITLEPRIGLSSALDSGAPIDGMSAAWRSPQGVVELAWKRSSSSVSDSPSAVKDRLHVQVRVPPNLLARLILPRISSVPQRVRAVREAAGSVRQAPPGLETETENGSEEGVRKEATPKRLALGVRELSIVPGADGADEGVRLLLSSGAFDFHIEYESIVEAGPKQAGLQESDTLPVE